MPTPEIAELHIEFTLSLWICVCACVSVLPEWCQAYKFVLHGRILKLFGTNNHDQTVCCVQES